MKLLLLGIALIMGLAEGSTLKMVTENTSNVTEQPGPSSSFGPFRDVQSVSEYEMHSTTPTITLLKELVNAYDDPVEYEVKKLEIIATTNKAVEVTTGQPTLGTIRIVSVEKTTTIGTRTTDVLTTTTPKDVPTTTTTRATTTAVPTTTNVPTTTRAKDVATTTTTKSTTTTTGPTTSSETTRAIPRRTSSTTAPARPPTPKDTRTTPVQITGTVTPTPKRVVKQPVHVDPRKVPVKGSYKQSCPRPEDIHPCECIEIRSHQNPDQVETVSFCKNIRNTEVLKDAMKGMQGHYINYFVVDSCKMPPFPNGLFQNVGIGWMEMLNSTIQFHENFFSCSADCW